MLLNLKNIGRFYNKTSININGITVLAGTNGTGKSTIGKALYCIYNSLYDYENKIEEERRTSIYRNYRLIQGNYRSSIKNRKKINEITDYMFHSPTDENILIQLENLTGISKEEIDKDVVERIKNAIIISDDDILNVIIKKRFESEFDSQVGHINYPGETSEIEVIIKDKSIKIQIDDDKVLINDKIKLLKDIAYIDDPYVIDDIYQFSYSGDYSHRMDIIKKLRGREEEKLTAIDDYIVNERLTELYEKLDNICGGIVAQKDEDEYEYKDKKLKQRLSVKNLSTGMKSFVVIKTLLSKGCLEENGIVILDEPEAHLHPEWMLLYAEMIVLLQKILKINFVISTHSSEFLSYIELYSKKHEIADDCKYYLLEEDRNDSTITNVFDYTENIDKIYDVLTRPFLWASKELDSQL